MSSTIALAVDLPATPARLYRMYLSPKLHGAFTGSPVQIAARAGARFSAFGGVTEGWSKYYFIPWRAYLTR